QVVGGELGVLPPRYHVDEIGFPLALGIRSHRAVHCHAEAAQGDPAGGVLQLRVVRQPTDQDHLVQHLQISSPRQLVTSTLVSFVSPVSLVVSTLGSGSGSGSGAWTGAWAAAGVGAGSAFGGSIVFFSSTLTTMCLNTLSVSRRTRCNSASAA